MKIICPEHLGPIDISDKFFAEALESSVHSTLLNCPVCNKEICIHHVSAGEEKPNEE